MQANDPQKLIRQLTIRTGRVQALARHIKEVETALSAEAFDAVFNSRTECRRKSEEAKRLREATFPTGMLAGTGVEPWTVLWESARRFSQELAYPGQPFPVVENGAHCVLCQQDIDQATRNRFLQFEAFVTSTTEKELRQARATVAKLRKTFTDLKVTTESIEETLKEVRIEHEAVSDTIKAFLTTAEDRRNAVTLALNEDRELAADCPNLMSIAGEVDALMYQIVERVKTLRTSATNETLKRMTAEALGVAFPKAARETRAACPR